ncbi:ATP-dependent nuclease [Pseudoalteromonas obscura]|uniref:AAA family ATPase n=1 Tax=Pseudoalteromonas obscura TaxID=3048491 RepID=A0ABT7EE24_9GAMM|nr:AAA family ATPase [Pseudoalteromonas sp. P94(2023)]MDK2593533.1 AAA family ATPase [Pseudoalteromonas sp. P94(2023)]
MQLLDNEHRDPLRPYIENGDVKIRRTQPAKATKKTDIVLEIYNYEDNEFRKNPRGIWNAIKGMFPDPIKIGAMEDASEDAARAKSTSTIGKLLKELQPSIEQKHTELVNKHLNAISRRISANGSKRPEQLANIDSSINSKLQNIFPGINIKLHFNIPIFDEIFTSGTLKVYENNNEGRDIKDYGHGAQRSIQMALIQHLAEVKRSADARCTTLLLIDEPELYLHPFAIEQVREALGILANNGYQVIFSTHSAQMITPDTAQNTLLIRKCAERETYTRQRISDAIALVEPSTAAQLEHLFSLTQSTQILFAENVVLTEGKTELRLLPFIYKCIFNKTLGQDNIALIETGSVDNVGKTLRILDKMDLPAKAIVDLDYIFKGAIHNGYIDEGDGSLGVLRQILEALNAQGTITMKGDTPNSQHCAILALQPEAAGPIQDLHDKLRVHNIWLWTKGAIEKHLGIENKSESAWAAFKAKIKSDGVEASCTEFQSILECSQWISN